MFAFVCASLYKQQSCAHLVHLVWKLGHGRDHAHQLVRLSRRACVGVLNLHFQILAGRSRVVGDRRITIVAQNARPVEVGGAELGSRLLQTIQNVALVQSLSKTQQERGETNVPAHTQTRATNTYNQYPRDVECAK